jgi:uncharacterized membrane protein YccC
LTTSDALIGIVNTLAGAALGVTLAAWIWRSISGRTSRR